MYKFLINFDYIWFFFHVEMKGKLLFLIIFLILFRTQPKENINKFKMKYEKKIIKYKLILIFFIFYFFSVFSFLVFFSNCWIYFLRSQQNWEWRLIIKVQYIYFLTKLVTKPNTKSSITSRLACFIFSRLIKYLTTQP